MIFKKCIITQVKQDLRQQYGDFMDEHKKSFTVVIVSDENLGDLVKLRPHKYVSINIEEE